MSALRIAWFSTGNGPGSRALLRAAAEETARGLPVEIACVFCNRERGEDANSDAFFALAESLGLPLLTLSSAAFRRRAGGTIVRKGDPLPQWRLDYDAAVLRLLAPFNVTIGVLAGYMLIFGGRACAAMTLLNLHPAAPGGPIGIWQDIIWELIAGGASQSGITIFRAVPEVDTGPPLSFCTYSLRGDGIDPLWAAAAAQPLD
ncbi:MAG: formyltransferase family protein, partial [Dehalococcoidia bacterium]